MQTIQIGLIGLGNIGTGVVQILQQQESLIAERLGARLELKRVATQHPDRERAVQLPPTQLTGDAMEVLHDPDIAIVVELVGGYEPARTYLLTALQQGKHVVTANKALLARHGREIFATASALGRDIGFEASVGGGIPIIRTIKEGFVANQFLSISCIINGTTNYILSQMSDHGLDFRRCCGRPRPWGMRKLIRVSTWTALMRRRRLRYWPRLRWLLGAMKPSTRKALQG